MDGAATDAVRGLKAEKDTDLALIWEALSRRFGHVDEPERAMRRFDVRRQQDGETLTLFEQNLRIRHREAWPKTGIWLGLKPVLSHQKQTRFCDANLWTESLTLNFRSTCDFMLPPTISRKQCPKLDSLLTRTSCRALRKSQLFGRRMLIIRRLLMR